MKPRSNKVLGYIRVSTSEQSVSGLGLADQEAVIARAAEARGWTDIEMLSDAGFSAKNLTRPAIAEALGQLERGEAGVLVVAKLDRLSRSLLDFASIMATARKQGWQLVVLDLAVDTTTPNGQLLANVLASFAEFERQLIGQRTSAALQQKKLAGARLGRPRTLDPVVTARIVTERAAGKSMPAIARALNDDGVPTARGGRAWLPGTVWAVLRSAALDHDAVTKAA